ncbi:MAG: DUF721 domain-containing protein [Ignavibacteriales bacterium]|nr:DUF721 domain-containing protein [Ignavibacteriales bacterium]MCF8306286.1 DUF721 domain-containing protein [Ignavibacteriales bacterium]MCF8316007.1 DUF721 domain-containing protein [Ignavibacteriales bacterium]MCF8437601.1 DUF721 domain-containing protein [Ignavibacteriales bacterium]
MPHDSRSLGEIISADENFSGVRKVAREYEVIAKFHEIIPELKSIAEPTKFVKSVLYLKVDNSIWRSELKFRQAVLINKINVFFKCDLVKSIKFTGR